MAARTEGVPVDVYAVPTPLEVIFVDLCIEPTAWSEPQKNNRNKHNLKIASWLCIIFLYVITKMIFKLSCFGPDLSVFSAEEVLDDLFVAALVLLPLQHRLQKIPQQVQRRISLLQQLV